MVRLEHNLIGHPLGGLLWEKWLEDNLLSLGWEKVPGWQCLFVHQEKQAFLSVYVDDFKMAGKAENLAGLWAAVKTKVDLDPPSPMSHQVYSTVPHIPPGLGMVHWSWWMTLGPAWLKRPQDSFKIASSWLS